MEKIQCVPVEKDGKLKGYVISFPHHKASYGDTTEVIYWNSITVHFAEFGPWIMCPSLSHIQAQDVAIYVEALKMAEEIAQTHQAVIEKNVPEVAPWTKQPDPHKVYVYKCFENDAYFRHPDEVNHDKFIEICETACDNNDDVHQDLLDAGFIYLDDGDSYFDADDYHN